MKERLKYSVFVMLLIGAIFTIAILYDRYWKVMITVTLIIVPLIFLILWIRWIITGKL